MAVGLLVTGACSPPAVSQTIQYFCPAVTETGASRSAPCQPLPSVVLNRLDQDRAASGCPGAPPLSLQRATAFWTACSPVKTSMRLTAPVVTGTQEIPTTTLPMETLSRWLVSE